MNKVLRILGTALLVLLISFLLLLIVLFIRFKTWERNFVNEIKPENMITQSVDEEDSINEKIEEYIVSQEDTDFITFTPKEVGQVVHGSLTEMVEGSNLEITNTYIDPSEGTWRVCGKVRMREYERIYTWVCADVTKDSMQTAQLYITEIKLQGIDIGKIYPKLVTKVNQGIAEALVTANENGFVGRVFENMELLENSIVVKGSLY